MPYIILFLSLLGMPCKVIIRLVTKQNQAQRETEIATATCVLSGVKCSTNDHPFSFKVGDVKIALSSIVKPSIQKLENSTLKTEAAKAIKTASSAMLNTLVDSIFQFVDQPMLPSET
ncbi:hypothetical protein L2E82_41919 [Cichorium intybus]|uniref:Uncharacterized protein n=1 Tax=Cichorium intybus TaxID=13427 RepID=A0ACB8ZKR7_CICIN|nr:hypothetical protein L2E82_41919 [Cichorium intybus]